MDGDLDDIRAKMQVEDIQVTAGMMMMPDDRETGPKAPTPPTGTTTPNTKPAPKAKAL